MSTVYLWWCLSDNETAADAREITVEEYEHPRDIAEKAADIDHSQHDAWESSWPRRYAIQATDGDDRKVKIFDVERWSEPIFCASAVRKCKAEGCKRLAGDAQMKLKLISTENLSITRDHNGEHDIYVLRGLLDGFGLRHDNQAQRGQLWLNPDEALTLHRMLGAMLEGEEPTP